jgi:hypothetical protein
VFLFMCGGYIRYIPGFATVQASNEPKETEEPQAVIFSEHKKPLIFDKIVARHGPKKHDALFKNIFTEECKVRLIDLYGKEEDLTRSPLWKKYDPWFYTEKSAAKPRVQRSGFPTPGDLKGRDAELEWLDSAISDPDINVACLFGPGGVGKSSIIMHWIEKIELKSKDYEDWEVYAYSFYRQGESEATATSSSFLSWLSALLEVELDANAIPAVNGETLANAIGKRKALLVLDGLEPLQHGSEVEEGRLKDPAIGEMLKSLAENEKNQGLCVITTRTFPADLDTFVAGQTDDDVTRVIRKQLSKLSEEDAATIFKAYKVTEDIDSAAEAVSRDALGLTLLANYTAIFLNGVITKADLDQFKANFQFENPTGALRDANNGSSTEFVPVQKILDLEGADDSNADKAAADMVLFAYEQQLEKDPHLLQTLYLISLYQRPASPRAIETMRRTAIPRLTDKICPLAEQHYWSDNVEKLREYGLLYKVNMQHPDYIDAHPRIREYFSERLRRKERQLEVDDSSRIGAGRQVELNAWRAGHAQLFRYYKEKIEDAQDSYFESQTSLSLAYVALVHGCNAGLLRQAYEIYYKYIRRQKEHYSWKQLGAVNEDLAALSSFYAQKWDMLAETVTPEECLDTSQRILTLKQTGLYLQAIGNLRGAESAIRFSLEESVQAQTWPDAADAARNLSEVLHNQGRLFDAHIYATLSVSYSKRFRKDESDKVPDQTTVEGALNRDPQTEAQLVASSKADPGPDELLWKAWAAAGRTLLDHDERRAADDAFRHVWELAGSELVGHAAYLYVDYLLDLLNRPHEFILQHLLYKPVMSEPPYSIMASQLRGASPDFALEMLKSRIKQVIEQGLAHAVDKDNGFILAEALFNLAKCQSDLIAEEHELDELLHYADMAVAGCKKANTMHHLPRALLVRARVHALRGNNPLAAEDIRFASIITCLDEEGKKVRGEMKLMQADCYLETAFLCVQLSQKQDKVEQIKLCIMEAQTNLKKAKAIIDETGYYRRQKDVGKMRNEIEENKDRR